MIDWRRYSCESVSKYINQQSFTGLTGDGELSNSESVSTYMEDTHTLVSYIRLFRPLCATYMEDTHTLVSHIRLFRTLV